MKKLLAIPAIFLSITAFAADYEAKHDITLNNYITPPFTNVMVKTTIFNQFTNNTDTPVNIMVRYNLFVEGCGSNKNQWSVKVNPHGTWRDHWQPFKECHYPLGNYRIDAQASIEGIDVPFRSEKWESANISVR